MAEPFVIRRVDALLVDLVQALDRDYPEVPYGLVARCVEVARRWVDERAPGDEMLEVLALVERVARDDLERIRSSMKAVVL